MLLLFSISFFNQENFRLKGQGNVFVTSQGGGGGRGGEEGITFYSSLWGDSKVSKELFPLFSVTPRGRKREFP